MMSEYGGDKYNYPLKFNFFKDQVKYLIQGGALIEGSDTRDGTFSSRKNTQQPGT